MSFLIFLATWLCFSAPKQYQHLPLTPIFISEALYAVAQLLITPTSCPFRLLAIDIVAEKMQKYAEGTSF